MGILKNLIRNTYVQMLVISAGVLLFYWQTTRYGFVLDDKIVITENKHVQKGIEGLKAIFTTDSMSGYLGDNPNLLEGGRYRPLSLAFFAIIQSLFGSNRFVFHLMNILFYIGLCVAIRETLLRLLKTWCPSKELQVPVFAATLIFAIHPIHTEVVANIKGLDEILAFLFAITGFLALIRFNDSGSKRWLFTGLFSLLLSFLSKESTLPFVVIIPLAFYFFRGFSVRKSVNLLMLMLIPAVVYFLIRYRALGYFISNDLHITGLMNFPYLDASFSEKYGTIAYTILLYLKLLFFPHPLTHDYYPWQIPLTPIYAPVALISIGVAGFLIYLAIKNFRRNNLFSFLILYFFLTLSIVSNVVINVGTLMNERFLFIPSLAFAFFITWGFNNLTVMKKGWLAASAALVMMTGFSYKTFDRIPAWESIEKLDATDVVISKNSARANMFYAVNVYEAAKKEKNPELRAAQFAEGQKYNNRSLEIYPGYGDALKMKAGFAAEIFDLNKDLTTLLQAFTEVIQVKDIQYVDDYSKWLAPRASDKQAMADFLFNAGYSILTVSRKNFKKGQTYLQLGYSVKPDHKGILFGLCVVSFLNRDFNQSISYGNQYLQLFGENADVLYYTGSSMINTGQPTGRQLVERAIQISPEIKNRKQ